MMGTIRYQLAPLCALIFAGCATQPPPVVIKEMPASVSAQQTAQKQLATPTSPLLKRKIAIGRVSNETSYGQSLLRDRKDDPLGKQISDLLSKTLTETGSYLVFERPDVSRIQDESALTGAKQNLIGVDALIVGSLTEFGRKTVGQSGFLSNSKRQVAFAKVDFRLVDVATGHVFFATSGAGESSTETSSVLGFGSQAGYDGTLNDSAIRQAVSQAVNRMTNELNARPWQTSVLSIEDGRVFLSGGKAQGVRPGMMFSVFTAGKKVKSAQTGFDIVLPGQEIAQLRIDSTFGDSETNEGSVASTTAGSISGHPIEGLIIRAKDSQQ